MFSAILQSATVDPTTAVSVSVLVIVVGAGWRLSSQLARIETQLSELAKLDTPPGRFSRIEQKVESMEREMEALWHEVRILRGTK